MKNTIKIALLVVIAGIGLAACTEGNAQPAAPTTTTTTSVQTSTTTPPPSTSTVHVTETQTKVVQAAQPADTGPVVDDTGYGKLKLGMKYDAAMKTGVITAPSAPADETGCSNHQIVGQGAQVVVHQRYGVIFINLSAGVRTVKGITIGSTADQVKKAYPNIVTGESGHWYLMAGANYSFGMKNGKVAEAQISLPGEGIGCHP